jgi:hypothetical protein
MAGNGDLKAHEATYRSITWLLKWGAIGCFLLALLVVWLIH